VVGRLFATLAGDSRDREQARGNAIVALSMMIGALTLTRIVSDSALSEEILARAMEHLHRQFQPH
jgi:TetR/AcrR family transcriptional regulator, transcriptional repressor for nem operon